MIIEIPDDIKTAAESVQTAIEQHASDYAQERWEEFQREYGLTSDAMEVIINGKFRPADQIDLSELGLRVGAYNRLRQEMGTVAELVEHTAYDLLDIRNFGVRSLIAVVEALDKFGLKLKDWNPHDWRNVQAYGDNGPGASYESQ